MTVWYKGRTLLSWEDDATEFTVEEAFDAYWNRAGNITKIVIPRGFTTDLASVPRIFQSIIPKLGHHIRPAIVHDFCYEGGSNLTRKEADEMFLEGMKQTKVSWLRRRVMWLAVRVGGRGLWG